MKLLLLLIVPYLSFAFYHCFFDAGKRYGVDPVLLIAIAKVESNFNLRAINVNRNGTRDYGIMQINSHWLERYKIPKEWLFEPCYNIHFGAMVLRKCMEQYKDISHAVDCYNKGSKAKGHGAYVERVFRNYKRYYTMLK
ncbi:lytic transglycosylase domain-containing protein [Pampinifervens florentissimum]|uniref:lytic transglycosylase domain-containing protein n=1 Tax=Pampinifervens florentissimum TaxID=1632019 RepID=UPI0013B49964|nr:lytic transglycosylase domain-containing protein [Hydrogenobacter sp. T-8]QID32605.1 lytic transglycosylase domain-containing protein [Hydrogenobacter sp. T-8]